MLKIPAYLDGFSSRKDRSAGIRFSTQELPGETFASLQALNGAFGWLLFDEQDIAEDDIPADTPNDDRVSPSQRFRRVLYALWIQEGKKGMFETFYRAHMEKVTEAYKAKLI